ncbi:MAG: hypothetical protein HDS35_10920 [Bacteroides sp.]|nr:hypothetical protein [Bacteroides sp.]
MSESRSLLYRYKEIGLFFNILMAAFLSVGVSLSNEIYHVLVPLTTLYIIWAIYVFRHLQLYVIFLIYLSIYFFYLYPYFYSGIQLSEYSQYQDIANYNEISLIFFLFYNGTICCAIIWKSKGGQLARHAQFKYGNTTCILYFGLLIGCVFLTMRQGVNVIGMQNSYDAYRSNLENTNSIPLITILVFYLYPFDSRRPKYPAVFWIISCLIVYFCITRGFRMVLAPYGLLLFYWFFDGKIKFRTLLFFTVIGFIIFIGVNAIKMNVQLEVNNALSESKSSNYIISHHADNLYVASAGIGLLRDGNIGMIDRILLNFGFLSEAVVPPSFLPDICKYPHIITKFIPTGGGGLFVVGSYFMWGEIGVWMFGLLLSKLITEAYKGNRIIAVIVGSVILIFAPRWASYDFHVILRFSVLAIFLYLLLCRQKKSWWLVRHHFLVGERAS